MKPVYVCDECGAYLSTDVALGGGLIFHCPDDPFGAVVLRPCEHRLDRRVARAQRKLIRRWKTR